VSGKEYKAADLHLEGDVGKVKTGKGKKILWNVLQDFPRGLSSNIDWAVTAGGGKMFVDKVTGLTFVKIPAGSFMMGSNETAEEVAGNRLYSDGELKAEWFKNEHPLHKVTISEPFYMATTETTVAAFKAFIKEADYVTDAEKQGKGYVLERSGEWKERAGASWRNPGFPQTDRHPVVLVSWNDAQAFVEWLNGKTNGPKFRLPTEAQWEYAARAGTQTPFFWGYKPSAAHANFGDASYSRAYPGYKSVNRSYYNDGHVHTAPVGSFKANPWGLYDMSGNAWEWCQDWYGDYSSGSQEDPTGPIIAANPV
jgi:formylglycine-generating enzyme